MIRLSYITRIATPFALSSDDSRVGQLLGSATVVGRGVSAASTRSAGLGSAGVRASGVAGSTIFPRSS